MAAESVKVTCSEGEYILDKKQVNNIQQFNKYFSKIKNAIGDDERIKYICFITDDNFSGKLCAQLWLDRGVMFSPGPAIEDDLSNLEDATAMLIGKWMSMTVVDEKEQYEGTYNGKKIKFNRIYGGYRFDDDECKKLLDGETIIRVLNGKSGQYRRAGKLGEGYYNGFKYYGFQWDKSVVLCPLDFGNHHFTEAEINALEAGKSVHIDNLYSKKKDRYYSADIKFNKQSGQFEFCTE